MHDSGNAALQNYVTSLDTSTVLYMECCHKIRTYPHQVVVIKLLTVENAVFSNLGYSHLNSVITLGKD